MPIYAYACQQCGHEFDALVRSSTVPACPHCHATELTKKLTAPAAVGTAPEPLPASPCGSCGHPDGPGACGMRVN